MATYFENAHRVLVGAMSLAFLGAISAATLAQPARGFAQDEPADLARYRDAALAAGDASKGKEVFESEKAACTKCHIVSGKKLMAGPDLRVIGDKYTRAQLITSILEPSAGIHPDHAAIVVVTKSGRTLTGVEIGRTKGNLTLVDNQGKTIDIPADEVETRERGRTSLMPTGLTKLISETQFADMVAFLTSLTQDPTASHPGMPIEIPLLNKPVKLVAAYSEGKKFDHPVWIVAKPGSPGTHLVVEQQTRLVWELSENGKRSTLFADLSQEAITGQFEGVMCLAFHPEFRLNGKYYLNYHVRENGVFSPVIVERLADDSRARDSGAKSRRLLKIEQETDLHWGGMLAFGPDGLLYIGAGDGGPQEDPDGHGQNLSTFQGKILRIDVNRAEGERPYAIPRTNPFWDNKEGILPEIWGYGFRMPWRFSWDSETGDLWVGDIGQNLFEEVTIARLGENHGWNVYEAFMPFSTKYRRPAERFTPPVFSYRRKHGVSVTGGYVYRGKRSPSFVGAYICADFESKRIWAVRQKGRELTMARQIGTCPEKPASFGIDHDGELFVVGYEGTIFRLILDDAVFE